MGQNQDQRSTGTQDDWRLWRFELTAHGQYVELSFEYVALRNEIDVERWARELEMALEHYSRPVDMLLDLRGVRVAATCGSRCGVRLKRILRRHAAAVSHFGGDVGTLAALEPTLMARDGGPGGRGREEALEWLMELRQRRLSATRSRSITPRPTVPGEIPRPREGEPSGATAL
ncbi:MAG: hypothetical protein AAF799_07970 [Myxococcota bacterium]